MKKVTIHTGVYVQNEYEDSPPQCAAYEINEEQLGILKHYNEIIKKDPNIESIKLKGLKDFWCAWYDSRPLIKPEELGRYLVNMDVYYAQEELNYDFNENPEEPRVDGDWVVITRDGHYVYTYGKYSGTKYESIIITTKDLEGAMTEDPAPKAGFYFRPEYEDYPKTLEEAPKYINSEDPAVRLYANECIRSGKCL